MGLRTWRLATILLTALSMGAALAHLLEMPAKTAYDAGLWLHLLQTLYPPGFGTAGAVFEVASLVSVAILVVLVRHRSPALGWTLVGAACLVASHALFWLRVAPVNTTLLPLTADTLPPDWMRLRDQWEHTHALRAVLQIVALGALVWSVPLETPAVESRRVDVVVSTDQEWQTTSNHEPAPAGRPSRHEVRGSP